MLRHGSWTIVVLCAVGITVASAQTPAIPTSSPKPKPPSPPAANVVAATVNNQPIYELAIFRATMQERPEKRAQARRNVLDFLIENTLVDQYLVQLKIEVTDKEVEAQMTQLRQEAKSEKLNFEEVLKSLYLTEADMRVQLKAATRWENFVTKYATDARLKQMFEQNRNMFDGSMVQAHHILVKTGKKDPKALLLALKRQIENEAAQAVAKLPPNSDNLGKEKARIETLTKAFASAAIKYSTCSSKTRGGSLGWFPRAGMMVEPFAKAAFALKPYQMSDVVTTQFGFHLILAVDRKAGRDVSFERVKSAVRDVYAERLRDAILDRMRPSAKIVIGR